jgi:signal transduction histidine kinase
LHDGLCQQLAAIGCAARALADDLQAGQRPEAQDAVNIERALQETVQDARGLARGIFPVHVDRIGLSAALAEMAQSTQRLTGVAIHVTDSAEVQLDDPEVSMHLFRIAQEAVANAVKHSGAREVVISILPDGNHLELRVDDNGRGMPARGTPASSGMGLRTMRYRVHALGAEMAIEPRAGGGTSIWCRVKIRSN